MTAKQKEEILFETKQINSLKMKRNKYAKGSKRKKALQAVISYAVKEHNKKRKKYGYKTLL